MVEVTIQNLDEADLNIESAGRHKTDGPELSLCAAYNNCPNGLKIGDKPPPEQYLIYFASIQIAKFASEPKLFASSVARANAMKSPP